MMHTNATKASPQEAEVHHTTERHKWLTLFSSDPHHKGLGHVFTKGALEVAQNLYNPWGTHPQLNRGLPTRPSSSSHKASLRATSQS